MLPAWTPDLDSLDLVLQVAETGSIGRAAAARGISQPSASAKLARLERRLGITLFVRTTAGTSLTPTGEALVAWARDVVAAAHRLTDGVATLRESADARLTVAASLTVAEYLLPSWLLAVRRDHPQLEVAAMVANSHDVAAKVRAGEADLGFLESPEVPDGVTGEPVGYDEVVLVVSSSYPLAARAADGIGAGAVAELPLLLREAGSGTRDTFLLALAAATHGPGTPRGPAPALPHATTLGSTATILAATRAGGGVGVLSARAVHADVSAGTLVRIPVRGLVAERPLTAIWLGRRPSPLARELVALARAHC